MTTLVTELLAAEHKHEVERTSRHAALRGLPRVPRRHSSHLRRGAAGPR